MTATANNSFSAPLEAGFTPSPSLDHATSVKLASSAYAVGDLSQFTSPTPTAYAKYLDMAPPSWGSFDNSPKPISDAAVKTTAAAAPADNTAAPDDVRKKLDSASSINFTSAADDQKNGVKPDYILGADGKLRANPDKTEPNKDGSVNIEVESKNKSDVQAKQYADKLQKAAIKDLISYFQASHPKGKVPQDWLDQLAKEPDLPPAPSPVANNSRPLPIEAPLPQREAPAPSGPAPRADGPAPQAAAPQMSEAPAPHRGGGGGGGGGNPGGGGGGGESPGGGYGGPRGGDSMADRSPGPGPGPGPGDNGPIPNLPDVASANPGAVNGNSLLTAGQQAFATEFAKKTGLDANVVGAWLLNEESGSAARSRENAGNMNWLNIGYTDAGHRGTNNPDWFNDPVKAADMSAAWMKGEYSVPGFGKSSHGIREIANTAGHSVREQISAINHSGWASASYPQMANLYNNVVRHNHSGDTELAAAAKTHKNGDARV